MTALLFIHMLKSNTLLTEMTDKEYENTLISMLLCFTTLNENFCLDITQINNDHGQIL